MGGILLLHIRKLKLRNTKYLFKAIQIEQRQDVSSRLRNIREHIWKVNGK